MSRAVTWNRGPIRDAQFAISERSARIRSTAACRTVDHDADIIANTLAIPQMQMTLPSVFRQGVSSAIIDRLPGVRPRLCDLGIDLARRGHQAHRAIVAALHTAALAMVAFSSNALYGTMTWSTALDHR